MRKKKAGFSKKNIPAFFFNFCHAQTDQIFGYCTVVFTRGFYFIFSNKR